MLSKFQKVPPFIKNRVQNPIFVVRITFLTSESTFEWQKRLLSTISQPKDVQLTFAFSFRAWCTEQAEGIHQGLISNQGSTSYTCEALKNEVRVRYSFQVFFSNFHLNDFCITKILSLEF